MARVTVEDCVDKIENRFELVLLASHRARQIAQGQQITIDRDNDKNPVVALREIADETLSPGDLKEDLIHSLQKHVEVDEPDAQMPLQGGERAGDDGLGDTQAGGGARDAALVGDGEEVPQMPDLDAPGALSSAHAPGA